MSIIFLVWMVFGIAASVMIGLGTSTDNEGIDEVDIMILAFFSLAGPILLFFGIPMLYIWLERKFG